MDVNAWWSAIGRHAARGVPVSTAWDRLGHAQQVILGGVTLWGGRLAYRIINRSLRRGIDDPRYEAAKKDPGFWNTAPFSVFLPEAIFQALISIPFTLPFRLGQLDAHTLTGAPGDLGSIARYTAAGLFTAGLALETLADWQIDSHKAKYRQNTADEDLYRNGVWSIVRHPNYLGDALVHFSFALWCWGIHQFHPLMALGPVMNYFFLRHVGGDKENEANQEARYRTENRHKLAQLHDWQKGKNSFWPSVAGLVNPWTWVVVGVGCGGALVAYMAGQ